MLPFSVVAELKTEAENRYLGEIPVYSSVSVPSKMGHTVVAVPLTRHFSVAPALDCIYSATYAALCQVVGAGAKKILFVLPKLSCMSWSPYPDNSIYKAAIFQLEQACIQFKERSKPVRPSLLASPNAVAMLVLTFNRRTVAWTTDTSLRCTPVLPTAHSPPMRPMGVCWAASCPQAN